VVGFATAITRGAVTYLCDLFVAPGPPLGWRGRDAAPAASAARRANPVYRGSRSPGLALYVRAGMRPQWPTSGCGAWSIVWVPYRTMDWRCARGSRMTPNCCAGTRASAAATGRRTLATLWMTARRYRCGSWSGGGVGYGYVQRDSDEASGIPGGQLGPLAPCARRMPLLYLRCPPMGTRTRHGGPLRVPGPIRLWRCSWRPACRSPTWRPSSAPRPGHSPMRPATFPGGSGSSESWPSSDIEGRIALARPGRGARGAPTGRPPLHQGKPLLLQVDKLVRRAVIMASDEPALGQTPRDAYLLPPADDPL